MNIYEQEASNKRWTVAIMVIFVAFFLFIGLGFDVFMLGMQVPGLNTGNAGLLNNYHRGYEAATGPAPRTQPVPYGTLVALLIASGMLLNSVFNGAAMVLSSSGARKANPSDPAEQQLLNVVEEMAIAAGLPVPQVYVVADDDPNAFATGFSPQHAYIAVTHGLLLQLNREELQGVISHEMSHVRNYDVRLMTVISALIGAIALLSDFSTRSARYGRISGGSRGSSREGKGNAAAIMFVIWIIFIILAPLISRLLALAVSRRREFLADASGAELTRNPLALASALEKIRNAVSPTRTLNSDGFAHMCIDDPRGTAINEKHGFWADLLATHPPMEKRILALKLMAYNKPVDI